MKERIADTLVVTFTTGISLRTWRDGGTLAREWALYERLAPCYGRMVLVTYGDEEDDAIARTLGASVQVVTDPQRRTGPEFAAYTAERVEALLGSDGSVVVKTNQMDGGEAALAIARRLRATGRRVGVIARGGYPWSEFVAREQGADSAAALSAGALEGSLCRGADVVVGTTERMVENLSWRHGLARERARVVPNYVQVSAAPPAPEAREPGLALCAGRLEVQKRMDLLIRAMALVRERIPEARLVVVGRGSREGELRELADSLGAPVEFRGTVPHEELQGLMRRCAAYVQTSAYEGHPKTVLEAMACGAPVVATEAPGLSDVVRHGETGLVASSASEGVAEAIARLLDDTALRAGLGSAAAAAAQRWSLDRVVEMESEAHHLALQRGAERGERRSVPPPVRWEPDLLDAPVAAAVATWAASVRGFVRRLTPRRRAEFLMALDEPLYEMQGAAAIDANDGLHPKHHLMRYHDFFVERIRAGDRVLDLGAGVGAVACSIAQRCGAQVTCVEIAPENLRKARERAERAGVGDRIALMEGDITVARAPGAFDVVVLSNVLEHMRDRPRLLRQWAQWYRPRQFLIRVPAFDRDWRTPWKRELGVEWRLDDTHEIEYTLESLRAEMSEAGLAITEQVANWGEYWIVAMETANVEAMA